MNTQEGPVLIGEHKVRHANGSSTTYQTYSYDGQTCGVVLFQESRRMLYLGAVLAILAAIVIAVLVTP
jgi:hypothetical protein